MLVEDSVLKKCFRGILPATRNTQALSSLCLDLWGTALASGPTSLGEGSAQYDT